MNMETIKFLKQLTLTEIVWYIDNIIFLLVIFFANLDLVRLCTVWAESISLWNYSYAYSILQMNSNNNGLNPNNIGGNPLPGGSNGGPTLTHHTHVQIVRDDGSWSTTIRSLFIYGTGGLRLYANFY